MERFKFFSSKVFNSYHVLVEKTNEREKVHINSEFSCHKSIGDSIGWVGLCVTKKK